jgi:hypothetical protein
MDLKFLEKAKEISGLQEQVAFELIPAQFEVVNEKNSCIERSCKYIADFVYTDRDGKKVVEDVKSPITRTKDYIIKRKLMLSVYGIRIVEI